LSEDLGHGLRVFAADEDRAALEELSDLLDGLGHEVLAHAVSVREAAEKIAADEPDVAMVVLHDDDEHALDLIEEIVEYGSGPVIALLQREDPQFVARAADRGIAAYARPVTPESVQGAIEVAVRRHAETEALSEKVSQLETALARRALIERAKGILMERHSINERAAFELMRMHARSQNRTVVAVGQAVCDGQALLPKAG
jgi:AmiR/NasT family two-component response regulator